MGERANRFENFARRPDRASDIDGPARRIGFRPGVPRSGNVDLAYPALRVVKLEAMAAAAEAVGQDDIGACLDEAAMQGSYSIGMLEVPQLRRIAGDEAHLEIIGSGCAVS